ncbi:MAG: SCO family protein, partial [Longimicrobiales bacterium]
MEHASTQRAVRPHLRSSQSVERTRRRFMASLMMPAVLAIVAANAAGCRGGTSDDGEDRARETGFHGVVLDAPQPRPDFTLRDTGGEPFRFRAETAGTLTLLFFGYTNCPDVCPVHLANLSAVLDRFAYDVRSRVRVVFVTTDPARDSPEKLRAWLDNFDPSFVGLTGTQAEVEA